MDYRVAFGVIIPFIGTILGASSVFVMKKDTMNDGLQKALAGIAAGVMVAASIWSLIIPAINMSSNMGKLAFLPAAVGFFIGIVFLLVLDIIIPHMHVDGECEGPPGMSHRCTMLLLAVAIHNLPEGMAVGVIFAGWMAGNEAVSLMGAIVLAIGIALQNFPEGAIVSMPLRAEGMGRAKAFFYGAASGIVEPIGAIIMILAAHYIAATLPYMLGFAAGAMMYVVVEELIPQTATGEHSNLGALFFAAGFLIMMILDVALA